MLRKTCEADFRWDARLPASMRPQRNAAENPALTRVQSRARIASMRPQRNAAENQPTGRRWTHPVDELQ